MVGVAGDLCQCPVGTYMAAELPGAPLPMDHGLENEITVLATGLDLRSSITWTAHMTSTPFARNVAT